MDERIDPRTLRLFDLQEHDVVVVTCHCGHITEHANGTLQRLHRVPSDTLIYDSQFHLRCKHCHRSKGFKIAIKDRRFIGRGSHHPPERVVVELQKDA